MSPFFQALLQLDFCSRSTFISGDNPLASVQIREVAAVEARTRRSSFWGCPRGHRYFQRLNAKGGFLHPEWEPFITLYDP